jgi:hypothetical protein
MKLSGFPVLAMITTKLFQNSETASFWLKLLPEVDRFEFGNCGRSRYGFVRDPGFVNSSEMLLLAPNRVSLLCSAVFLYHEQKAKYRSR